MNTPPHIPGLSELEEIGRNSLVVGYRCVAGGLTLVVEVLLADDPENRQEFFRSSALQTRMAHPGMPPIQKVGLVDDRPYRTREYVEGRPVSGLFTDGPLSEDRLIVTGRALASTLESLHRRGMVHTEITPQGLRVDSSGLIRFLDTGRAWPLQRPLPRSQRQLSLPYLAPEYQEGEAARSECDIYALGSVLMALSMGKPAPSGGISRSAFQERASNLSPALRVILKTMLSPNPIHRPEAQTLADCFSRIDEINAHLKLQTWRPPSYATTFLGSHAYPLIGREREMGKLMSLWQKAIRGKGQSVTIVGPKGSGRRRLVEELRRAVQGSGGVVVRHRGEANFGTPTLIINQSHQKQSPSDQSQPWLSVNFAHSEAAGEKNFIALEPLGQSSCLRLAECYLGSPSNESLQAQIYSGGALFPGELILRLDQWCEEGALRPDWEKWSFEPQDAIKLDSPRRDLAKVSSSGIKLDYQHTLRSLMELWAISLEQDEPVQASMKSLCTLLQCRRVDLYRLRSSGPQHVAGSSLGRHRLEESLLAKVLQNFEPAWEGNYLLYPLRFGIKFSGLLCLQWWEEGVPEMTSELFGILNTAGSPLSFFLGEESSQGDRFDKLADSLEHLVNATAEPSDILQRLSQSLRLSLDFEHLVAWLFRDGRLDRLFTDPPGLLGFEKLAEESITEPPFLTRQLTHPDNSLVSLPLTADAELLGAVTLSRAPSTPFTEAELALLSALGKVAQATLRNARVYGEQNALLQKTRYRFLAAQIRPHFLFNALNTLAAMVTVDPEQTEDLILDTAEFLRTTFTDRPEVVTVSEEIHFLELYLRLEKARFGKRLATSLEIDPAALNRNIPVLTLQPLVENAVRHGVTVKAEGGTVRLQITAFEDGYRVEVSDDGAGFDADCVTPRGTGVGLSNVRERLERHFGEKCQWQLQTSLGSGTSISFLI